MSSLVTNIDSLLTEDRVFPPPEHFSKQAHIKSMAELEALRSEASTDPEGFWSRMAEELSLVQKVGQGTRMEGAPLPNGLSAAN